MNTPPLTIVCGNSDTMIGLVRKTLDNIYDNHDIGWQLWNHNTYKILQATGTFSYIMGKRRKKRNKKKTLKQIMEYLNDKSLYIKRVSREYFMGTDIGTRKHKDKKKYTRKIKHKKNWRNE